MADGNQPKQPEPTEAEREALAREVQEQVGIHIGQVFLNPRTGYTTVFLEKQTVDTITARFGISLGAIYAMIGRDSTAAGCAHIVQEQTKGRMRPEQQIVTAASLPAGMPPPPRGRRGKGGR